MDNDISNPDDTSRGSLLNIILGIVALLLVIIVGLMLYSISGWSTPSQSVDNLDPKISQASDTEKLMTGSIYFNDDDLETQNSGLYKFDLERRQISEVLVDEDTYLTSFVPNSKSGFYLASPYDAASPFDFPYTEYKRLNTQEDVVLNEKVTSLDVSLIKDLAWSEAAQRLAFSGLSQEATNAEKAGKSVDYNDIANFSTYVVAPFEAGAAFVEYTSSVSPKWSTDGMRLYVLEANGIFSYDLETANKETVYSDSNYNLSRWSTFVLTADGSHVVFGAPPYPYLYIQEVTNDDVLETVPVTQIKTPNNTSPYSLFTISDSDKVGFVHYLNDRAYVSTYDLSEDTYEAVFDIGIDGAYNLQPVWVEEN